MNTRTPPMLPNEVRNAVDAMNLRFTSGNEIPVERAAIRDHEWAAIKAHLLAREAEGDAVSTELRTMRGEFAKQFKRAERAEAVLREIRDSTFRNATTLRGMADRYLSHANQQELP